MKYTDMSYYVYEKDGVIECTTVMPPAGRHMTRWTDVWALLRMIDPNRRAFQNLIEWNDQLETEESIRAMTRG